MNRKIFAVLFAVCAIVSAAAAVYRFMLGMAADLCVDVFFAAMCSLSPIPFMLSSRLAVNAAAKRAQKRGIKLESVRAVDVMRKIDTIIFTKSGVLTEGRPLISDIVPIGTNQRNLLTFAATAEENSAHPVGRAIYYAARNRGLKLMHRSASSFVPHAGAEAIINGNTVRVGKLDWLLSNDIDVNAALLTKKDQLSYHGKIVVFVSVGNSSRGLIALKDDIKPESLETVHRLKKLGMTVLFFTNESKRNIASIERETELSLVSEMKPQEKIREIQLMRSRGAMIAVAGDTSTEQEVFYEADLSIHLQRSTPKENDPPNDARAKDAEAENFSDEGKLSLREKIFSFASSCTSFFARRPKNDVQKPESRNFCPDMILNGDINALIPAIGLSQKTNGVIRKNRMIAALFLVLFAPASIGALSFVGFFLPAKFAFLGMLAVMLIIKINSSRI